VKEVELGGRRANGTEGARFDGVDDRGRGRGRRLSALHSAAPRRLPPCAPADGPDPDVVIPASLPAAPRDEPSAQTRR